MTRSPPYYTIEIASLLNKETPAAEKDWSSMTEQDRTTERLSAQVVFLYDQYRTARYNALYYGKRLKKTKRQNFILEAIIALAAPGSIGTWFVFGTAEYGLLFAKVLGAFASVAAIIKPLSSTSDNLQRYTRLNTTYNEIASELGQLVEKVRIEQDYSRETQIRFDVQAKRMGTLAALDDPEMAPEEEDRCYQRINEQVPADSLWIPSLPIHESRS